MFQFVFWRCPLALLGQPAVLAEPPEHPREGSQGNQRFEQAPARLAIFFVGVNLGGGGVGRCGVPVGRHFGLARSHQSGRGGFAIEPVMKYKGGHISN